MGVIDESGHWKEKAAHRAHREETERLAGGVLHEEHAALTAVLAAAEKGPARAVGGGDGVVGTERKAQRVITNAEAAALKAEEMEREGQKLRIFPPLLRGDVGGGNGGIKKWG